MQTGKAKPRIAFVSRLDAKNLRTWSGTLSSMALSLDAHVGEVCHIGPADSLLRKAGALVNRITVKTLRKQFDPLHTTLLAQRLGQIFSARLKSANCDLIFAPVASTEIAYLETNLPIVYLSDLTWANIINYYPEFSSLLSVSLRQGEQLEKRAIAKASALVYPSKWAAEAAIQVYGANAEAVHCIPFGANLQEVPLLNEVMQRQASGVCRLLFVGVSWERKGGDIALETLLELERRGIPCELTICGCVPPADRAHPHMRVIPFLDKSVPEQRRKLSSLFMDSHFFLFPTRGDATPIVLCEASAFGLPSITCDTGGVRGAVTGGENGVLLPFSAGGHEYADAIATLYTHPAAYSRMVEQSRAAFDTRLNWNAWGTSMRAVVETVLP